MPRVVRLVTFNKHLTHRFVFLGVFSTKTSHHSFYNSECFTGLPVSCVSCLQVVQTFQWIRHILWLVSWFMAVHVHCYGIFLSAVDCWPWLTQRMFFFPEACWDWWGLNVSWLQSKIKPQSPVDTWIYHTKAHICSKCFSNLLSDDYEVDLPDLPASFWLWTLPRPLWADWRCLGLWVL